MPYTKAKRTIVVAQVDLEPADHRRLAALAAAHERSARAEARWAIRQWLDQHMLPAAMESEQG
jgi:hypothetical protein